MIRDEDAIAEARADAAHDSFLRDALKCADCGELWNPGWHRATRTDPAYADQTECPCCGCGDTIAQDEQSVAEVIRDALGEMLLRWGRDRAAARLKQLDGYELWGRYRLAGYTSLIATRLDPRGVAVATLRDLGPLRLPELTAAVEGRLRELYDMQTGGPLRMSELHSALERARVAGQVTLLHSSRQTLLGAASDFRDNVWQAT